MAASIPNVELFAAKNLEDVQGASKIWSPLSSFPWVQTSSRSHDGGIFCLSFARIKDSENGGQLFSLKNYRIEDVTKIQYRYIAIKLNTVRNKN